MADNRFNRLFGWAFKRKEELVTEPPSFAAKEYDDGSITVTASGAFGTYVDLDGTVRTEAELISRYRDMSLHPEVDSAIDEIINEAISTDEDDIVKLILDKLDFPDKVKKAIQDCFDEVVQLIDFHNKAYNIMRRWYIDGRLYFHTIIDEEATTKGIKELRYIDPRKIRKVREIIKKRVPGAIASPSSEAVVNVTKNEYYMYNDKGFNIGNKPVGPSTVGLRIAKDAILYVTSGLTDSAGQMVLSFMHSAIKPLNQLRTLEDAVVIYRLARAPERRIWYIDVGNLPKMKAEQYVREIMVKHKNRLVYDGSTGQVLDSRKFLTMLEDYWLPRREGGRGTEVETLPAGCLAMDTKVPLLDGRTLTITEISEEFNQGKENWVYSCNPKTGEFAPGLITWAGVTQEFAKVVKLTLDNNQTIIITPDHKFPVWDRGLVETKDLQIGDSLIPRNVRTKIINKNDYEQVFNNYNKKWEFTHRLVGKQLRNKEVFDFIFDNKEEEKTIIHHKDINRFNNSPKNLCWMGFHDHRKFHQSIGFPPMIGTIAAKKCLEEQTKEYNKIKWNDQNLKIKHKEKQKIETDNTIVCAIIDLVKGKTNHEITSWDVANNLNQNLDILKHFKELNKNKSVPNWNGQFTKNIIIKTVKDYGYKNWLDFRRKESCHNHRIIKIEYIDEPIKVGTLTIDGLEQYHNYHTFALDSGVYTKNSNLGQMEDVLYFQKRLYSSLHVPINRLDPNNQYNMGIATEVTRDEIKFGKFIARMRSRFAHLFISLLEKQVVLKQVMTIEDFQKIAPYLRFNFVNDNYFIEMKNAMVYQNRFNMANLALPFVGKYYSHEWLRKHIFMQTDDEIERMDQQVLAELQDPFYSPPPTEPPEAEDDEDGGGDSSGKDSGVMVDQGPIKPPPGVNMGTNNQNEKPRDFKSIQKKLAKGT